MTARALAKSNVTKTIGVLIANTKEGIFEDEVKRGLDDAQTVVTENGTHLDVRFIEGENTDLIRQHLVEFMNIPIDGLIIYGKIALN